MMRMFFLFFPFFLLAQEASFYRHNALIPLTPAPHLNSNKHPSIRFYQDDKGHIMGVNDTIVVQCMPHVACQKDLNITGVLEVQVVTSGFFAVKTKADVFETAKALKKLPSVKHAHPNFIRKFQPR